MKRIAITLVLLAWAGGIHAQPAGDGRNGRTPPQGHVAPGAEDGFFSAEDYRALKDSRGRDDGETRSLVRTRDGVIIIRKQNTPNGPRYQVQDTRPYRRNGTVIVVPQ